MAQPPPPHVLARTGRGRTAREREHVPQLVHDLLALQLLVGVAEHLECGRGVRVLALVRVHLRRGAGA